MDILVNPSVMGGIVVCVAIAGWALGRWQSDGLSTRQGTGDPAGPHGVHPPPAAPFPWRAHAGGNAFRPRQSATPDGPAATDRDPAQWLGDLHAEVSAYRRAEQVLAGMDTKQLEDVPQAAADPSPCRAAELRRARRRSDAAGRASVARAARPAGQLSPAVPDRTRV